MFINSWIILTFHNLGILEYVAKFYNKSYSIKLMKFYSEFHEFCIQEESLFSNEYKKMLNLMNSGYSGKGWDHYDMELSDINWPIEEASWLRITTNKDRLRNDILSFIQKFEKKHGKIDGFSSVIFYTGWQKNLQKKYYFTKNPGLSVSAAKYLASKKVSLVGIDSPSIDLGTDSKFSVHQIFAKKGILIVENLANLDKIKSSKFHLVVLPLKLKNATGSPVRAVAFVD